MNPCCEGAVCPVSLLKVGMRIVFHDESEVIHTVVAATERWVITTCEVVKGELWYSIIDRHRNLRGPHDRYGVSYDVTNSTSRDKMLDDLDSGEIGLDARESVPVSVKLCEEPKTIPL